MHETCNVNMHVACKNLGRFNFRYLIPCRFHTRVSRHENVLHACATHACSMHVFILHTRCMIHSHAFPCGVHAHSNSMDETCITIMHIPCIILSILIALGCMVDLHSSSRSLYQTCSGQCIECTFDHVRTVCVSRGILDNNTCMCSVWLAT